MSRRKIEGQEEIQEALDNKDIIRLWSLVRYIGYNRIPSTDERKLVFYRAYKNFDENVNDNFVAYYNKCIHYEMLNTYKRKISALSCDNRARKKIEDALTWPTYEDMLSLPKTQNENILSTFII